MDTELKDKYGTVEELITKKAQGVADAKKRAEILQQEAKELLLQASDKLQLLKGTDLSSVQTRKKQLFEICLSEFIVSIT